MIKLYLFFVLTVITFISCSSSVEETRSDEKNDTEDVYIFDEIPETESPQIVGIHYLVQIGAFTTKQNAESFAESGKIKLNRELKVVYDSEVHLFVVRLDKKFTNKKEADAVRDEIRKDEEFSDAWVVSSER